MDVWLSNETAWDSWAQSSPISRKAIYGKDNQRAGRALHSWGVTQPGGVGAIVGISPYSAQRQLRGYFNHSSLPDRRSLLRSSRFRSTAASGPVTARCTQPETVRGELERFCSLSHGYLLLSLFPTCRNDPFFIPLLQKPSMFSLSVYRGCTVAL